MTYMFFDGQGNWQNYAPWMTVEAVSDFVFTENAKGIACLEQDEVVGVVTVQVEAEEVELTSLYVVESHRKQGIGTNLLSHLYWYLMSETTVKTIHAQGAFLPQETQEALEGVLKKAGYRFNLLTSQVLEFTLSDVTMESRPHGTEYLTLSQVTAMQRNSLGQTFHQLGYFPQGHLPKTISQDHSLCAFYKEKLQAALLLESLKDNVYRIALLYSAEQGPAALLFLVTDTVNHCKKALPMDTRFVVDTYSENTRKIILHLTQNKAKSSQAFLDATLVL